MNCPEMLGKMRYNLFTFYKEEVIIKHKTPGSTQKNGGTTMDDMENKVISFDQDEISCGLKAVKEWLQNTYYEGVTVLREHKKAIMIAAAAVVGVVGIVGGLIALLRRRK